MSTNSQILQEDISHFIGCQERLVYVFVGKVLDNVGGKTIRVSASSSRSWTHHSSVLPFLEYLSGPRTSQEIQAYIKDANLPTDLLANLMDAQLVVSIDTKNHSTAMKSFRNLRIIAEQPAPNPKVFVQYNNDPTRVELWDSYVTDILIAKMLYGNDDNNGSKAKSDLPTLGSILKSQSKISQKQADQRILGQLRMYPTKYICPSDDALSNDLLDLTIVSQEMLLPYIGLADMLHYGYARLEWL